MVLKPESNLYPPASRNSLIPLSLSKHQRMKRWAILGFFSAPLIGSVFYRYGYHLPFLKCPLRSLTGIPCPTCGMTRSFVAIAQGNLNTAIEHHLFGPAIFLLFLVGTIFVLWELKTNKNLISFCRRKFAKSSVYFSIGIFYLGYYAIRMTRLVYTGELSKMIKASPAGALIIHAHFYVS
jgi:Protein of unknown function (DUF2752)